MVLATPESKRNTLNHPNCLKKLQLKATSTQDLLPGSKEETIGFLIFQDEPTK